jgi:hypothetical protein
MAGRATFPEGESGIPVYAPVCVGGLTRVRDSLADLSKSQHGIYIPHVTLTFVQPGDPLPAPQPEKHLVFPALSIRRGDEQRDFRFGPPDGTDAALVALCYGLASEVEAVHEMELALAAGAAVVTPGGAVFYHVPAGKLINPALRAAARKEHGPVAEQAQFEHEAGGASRAPDLPQASSKPAVSLRGEQAHQHVSSLLQRTPEDDEAINWYASGGHSRLASHLRGGGQAPDEETAARLAQLDSMFRRAKPTSQPVEVHRGHAGLLTPEATAPGTIWQDRAHLPAHTSATGIAKQGAHLKITVPTGSKALALPGGGVLLPSNSALRHTGADSLAHHAELVPPRAYKPLTSPEHGSHVAQIDDQVAAALDGGQATDQTETLGHGIWKPARAQLHNQIVKEKLDEDSSPLERKGMVVTGPPGADQENGKGFLHTGREHMKAELARRGMVPRLRGVSPMEAAPLVHGESGHLARLLADAAYRQGRNVAFHAGTEDPGQEAGRMAGHGYAVTHQPVHAPLADAIAGTRKRHRSGNEAMRQGSGPGGRYISPYVLRSMERDWPAPDSPQVRFALSVPEVPDALAVPGEDEAQPEDERADPDLPETSSIDGLLIALERKQLTLAKVTALFRDYPWKQPEQHTTWEKLTADAAGTGQPADHNFADVARAYAQGRLTDQQYTALARAAAAGMKGSTQNGARDAGPDVPAGAVPAHPGGPAQQVQ